MTNAHHRDAWAKVGMTSVDNGVLLCPRHHTVAHDTRHQMKTDRHGKITFTKRN